MIQVEVQPLDKQYTYRVCTHISQDIYQAEYKDQLGKIRSKAQIPGFRNGKVPLSVIQNRFGTQLKQETAQTVIKEHLSQILEQSKLEAAIEPSIEEDSMVWQDGIRFNLLVAEWPVIDLKQLETIGIEHQHITIDDTDIEVIQAQLLQQELEYMATDAEHIVTVGDRLEAAFSITLDGKKVRDDQIKDTSEQFYIASLQNSAPELYNALLGRKVGDEVEATRPIEPEEHIADAEIRDEKTLTASYKINILIIDSPRFAADIAELCAFQDLGSQHDLPDILRKYMQDKIDVFENDAVSNAAISTMLKTFNPQISDMIIQHSVLEQKQHTYKRCKEEEGMSAEEATKTVNDAQYLHKLAHQVREGMRLNSLWIAIGKEAKIKINDDDVFAHIEAITASQDASIRRDMINHLYKNNYETIANKLFYQLCNEYVLQRIHVDDITVSYREWAAAHDETEIDIARLKIYKPAIANVVDVEQVEQQNQIGISE